MDHNRLSFKLLKWDSDFFGFKVGEIQGKINSYDSLDALLTTNQSKLTYYSSDNKISEALISQSIYNIDLVDRKSVYSKSINYRVKIDDSVSTYKQDHIEEKLLDLAVQSGKYSRFNVDMRIEHTKFIDLYHTWITNSVNGQLALAVLVYRQNDEILGFVTIGEKEGIANIGLIAVDTENRGLGIGKKLMESAENWSANHNYSHIQIVTQADNVAASGLYCKLGYKLEFVEYFHHIWT